MGQAIIRLKFIPHRSQPAEFHQLNRIEKILQRKLSKDAKKRLAWMDYYFSHGQNASLTCRHFDISRKTFYKWLRRYDKNNLSTLENLSKSPQRKRTRQLTIQQEQRIIALRRKYIRYGKEKISVIYENLYKEKMSSWHIQKVIEKYNLYYNPMGNETMRKKRKLAQKKKRITELKNKKVEGLFFQIDTIVTPQSTYTCLQRLHMRKS
ncbi:MAG: helix-turn-helix domain-containing protein [Candidatus Omnitrophica bacterium]|nr:helix-turn-helix domain-containing protein [Candidatus Omnitrophota bacterium]